MTPGDPDRRRAELQELKRKTKAEHKGAMRELRKDNAFLAERRGAEAAAAYDSLNHVEQAAASLGAHPDALKPISFMNAAHYQNLIKQNALSDDLARRIEAYKVVAASSE